MKRFKGLVCPRCQAEATGNYYDPCPICQKEGVNVNYETVFDLTGAKLPENSTEKGIFKYREFFALDEDTIPVTLNEGDTPLYQLEKLGKLLGMENLYIKDESKNPTMSHKDRMCSLIVTKAKAENAQGVTISSTGNQGCATAAYCAKADIPCVIFTTPNVSQTMKATMQAFGAKVFVTESMADRVVIMEKLVRQLNYVPASGIPTPPIGSSCYALDGYKTISFEMFRQMNDTVPDHVIVPISYGDTLYGIYKGMRELKEMGYINRVPKFIAAEVFGATKKTLENKDLRPITVETKPSVQTAIATGYTAYHTVKAIESSKGTAVCSTDDEVLEMQKVLAQTEGIFAEASSISAFVTLKKLLENGFIKPTEKVVVVLTSTGIKEPETVISWTPDIPTINPTLEEFQVAFDNYK